MQNNSSSYSEKIASFWRAVITNAQTTRFHTKNCKLPLARIKRLMKVEEDVKMVAAEVPALFSFVAEIFVQELTSRAWMCTEDGKRKILQSSDIGFAVKTSSMYDFLTYVVPMHPYSGGKDEYLAARDNQTNFQDKYPFNESRFVENAGGYSGQHESHSSYFLADDGTTHIKKSQSS